MQNIEKKSPHLQSGSETESRPDWDPYTVWLTHVMNGESAAATTDEPRNKDLSEATWKPFNVWQSLIKS